MMMSLLPEARIRGKVPLKSILTLGRRGSKQLPHPRSPSLLKEHASIVVRKTTMLENALYLLCAVTVKRMTTIYSRVLRTHALREGRLNTVKAPSNTSSDQGTSSILVGDIMFHGRSIHVLFDTGASHSFISKELVGLFSLEVVGLMTSIAGSNPIGMTATLSLFLMLIESIVAH